jgi:hypothetical protein
MATDRGRILGFAQSPAPLTRSIRGSGRCLKRVKLRPTIDRQSRRLRAEKRTPSSITSSSRESLPARSHAEKLCKCFPTSGKVGDFAPRIAEWAERWPQDYLETKSRAEESLEKIKVSIEAIERQRRIEKPKNNR